ncbi:MAG: hypothetical protein LBE84_00820 [Planctomycetota bacterium]|nr:hypothetical protein [Planctomycetota bacterium]
MIVGGRLCRSGIALVIHMALSVLSPAGGTAGEWFPRDDGVSRRVLGTLDFRE